MAKVIDLKGKRKIREDLLKSGKLESLSSLIRCNHCSSMCAKCGTHGEATSPVTHYGSGVSFRLCPKCLEEYEDLMAYLEADDHRDAPYWFNREWVRHWLAWLDYQWALTNYISSPEVLEVLTELREH